jgi:hypothetical protein
MSRPLDEGELTGLDADGTVLREWDGVVLLKPLTPTSPGNCDPPPVEIPAGVRATAIALIDPDGGLFDLECYLDATGERYAFAHGYGRDLRLVEKIEDKKTVEI